MKTSVKQFCYKTAAIASLLTCFVLLDLLITGQLSLLATVLLGPAAIIFTDYFFRLALRRRKTVKRRPACKQAVQGFTPTVVINYPGPNRAA